MNAYTNTIKRLHHCAYRCRNTEETRQFYEDLLGLRLSAALELTQTKTGRPIKAMHSFFEMDDNSFLAFFEVPQNQDESMFPQRWDFDLHLALNVEDMETLQEYQDKLEKAGHEVRGPSDHGFCHAIYVYDPNGYVLEIVANTEDYDVIMGDAATAAHDNLAQWQQTKHEPLAAATAT